MEVHRFEKPWMFHQSGVQGLPRQYDGLEMRRLMSTDISQICSTTVKQQISYTDILLVENNQATRSMTKQNPYIRNKAKMQKHQKIGRKIKGLGPAEEEFWALVDDPNPNGQSFQELTSMIITDQDENGDGAFQFHFFEEDLDDNDHPKRRDGGVKPGVYPAEIVVNDILHYNKHLDEHGILKGFYYYPHNLCGYGSIGRPQFISRNEVAWFPSDMRSYLPYSMSNTWKAMARLDLLLLTIAEETDIFREGVIGNGILSLMDFKAPQMERWEYLMDNEAKGRPDRMMWIDGEVKYTPFSFNYAELQFLERQLWYVKMIAGVWNLTLSFLGLAAEKSNRATAWAERAVALENGIAPRMKSLEYILNTQFWWRFYDHKRKKRLMFDPMMSLEDQARLTDILTKQVAGKIRVPNEARGILGEPDIEGGDEFVTMPSATSINMQGGIPETKKNKTSATT